MISKRKIYLNQLKYYKENEKSVVVIQSYFKMLLQRRRYLARLKYFRNNVSKMNNEK